MNNLNIKKLHGIVILIQNFNNFLCNQLSMKILTNTFKKFCYFQ